MLPSVHKQVRPPEARRHHARRKIDAHAVQAARKLVFVRDSGRQALRIVEPRDYRADNSAIDGLVRQIFEATFEHKADVVNNPKQYGLEPPAEVITLIKEGEPRREVKLNVGETSDGTGEGPFST